MAKRENPNNIPKKFRNSNKSFLDHLLVGNGVHFQSFPQKTTFYGKEKGEHIVLIVRRHWIMYIQYILASLFFLFLPYFFYGVIAETTTFLSLVFGSSTIALSIGVFAFVRWFYNVNIITDCRVVDIDFTNVVSHTMSEAKLGKIVDITHKQVGFIGSIFDIGTVYIQTAGSTPQIDFNQVPRPREVQDILYDLLETEKEGKK